MDKIELLILNYIQDAVDVLIRNIALVIFLSVIALGIVAYVVTHILYKYHKRIKNKFAVYILNNSWISILWQRILLMMELNQLVQVSNYAEDTYWVEQTSSSFWSRIKFHFATILRNVTNYFDIVNCKNYFRFK